MARFLADKTWGLMLWLIRRPLAKSFRRWLLNRFPESSRGRVSISWVLQDRLARRMGRRLLYWSYFSLVVSIAITLAYLAALWLIERDFLPMPRRD